MIVRNVVRIGNSYYISLPKDWVDNYLKDNRVVMLRVLDSGLIEIRPALARRAEERTIKIEYKDPESTIRMILGAYLNGYDVIEISSRSFIPLKFREELEAFLSRMVGLEVVEDSRKHIMLQCFATGNGVGSVIRRMNSITRLMYVDAVRACCEGSRELAESVVKRDDKVDKLYFFAVRSIRKLVADPLVSSEDKLRLLDLRLIAQSLERIGDSSESLAAGVLSNSKNYLISGEEASLLQRLSESLSLYQKSLIEAVLRNDLGLCPVGLDLGDQAVAHIISTARKRLRSPVLNHLLEIYGELNDILDLLV